MADYREKAIRDLVELRKLAAQWPAGSPGRKLYQKLCRRLRLVYISTAPEKKLLILGAIRADQTVFSDIQHATSIDREDLRELLTEMIAAGQIREQKENPVTGYRGGRKFSRYLVLEK